MASTQVQWHRPEQKTPSHTQVSLLLRICRDGVQEGHSREGGKHLYLSWTGAEACNLSCPLTLPSPTLADSPGSKVEGAD